MSVPLRQNIDHVDSGDHLSRCLTRRLVQHGPEQPCLLLQDSEDTRRAANSSHAVTSRTGREDRFGHGVVREGRMPAENGIDRRIAPPGVAESSCLTQLVYFAIIVVDSRERN